ncbi:hypothetical protein A264_27792 [Pseudomonas syringae pv. actinidiae ICMP 19071]|uniref:plasmid replication initiator TrfA n=1 Tax=Pseudomonas syringae group TaxID=136849 RepID=UPI0003572803|nr:MULTISPECIES: plasmid replication initiator TrfA [Pseudomonas syringae group]EPM53364.1 hypothetical protein A264_27792 [Pseudomonas syringae pv. actinidiae ICMP 19071]EPM73816.1 hypothetical protein A3SO_27835 [Pseudomonas syringae pv. actinidiae ICMP 19072]RMS10823.1 hypothetical protein ALP75_204536 [Pseudomonas syringae pv. actinidiae]RMV34444.1 hypothetical protein ALP12_200448 [Pseudomonas savastanoi pv. phaseolicola]
MAKPLEGRLKAMAEKAKKRSEVAEQQDSVQPACDERNLACGAQVSEEEIAFRFSPVLPSPGDDRRAMANAILRSSLFGVVEKGKRKYEKKVHKITIQGLSLSVTGEQLDQSDLDVFLECLHRHQGQTLGTKVRFTAGSFLRTINRDVGKANYLWLNDVLARLSLYGIELGDGQRFYLGTLLNEMYRDESSKEYVIAVNPKFSVFFADGLWTGLDTKERQSLKGKALALWLHGFYSTHEKPFPYKVETLKGMCGSVTVTKEFRRTLKKAMVDVSTITGWTCNIDPKTDLVNVVKTKAVRHE